MQGATIKMITNVILEYFIRHRLQNIIHNVSKAHCVHLRVKLQSKLSTYF